MHDSYNQARELQKEFCREVDFKKTSCLVDIFFEEAK